MSSLKHTQESAVHNSNILVTFNGNLGKSLKAQHGSSLDHGSELQNPVRISNLFRRHKYRYKRMDIIQRGSQYLLSIIEEASRKSYLAVMILCGNKKSSKTNLNDAALEKSMRKEVEHG